MQCSLSTSVLLGERAGSNPDGQGSNPCARAESLSLHGIRGTPAK
jgi:hypothetical protein